MTWPAPKVGQIIRYAYLWKREAEGGQEEGLKDRPTVIVIAQHRNGKRWRAVVAPITHAPSPDPDGAVEIPEATRRRVGLDAERQWIVLTDLNSFLWPGPDLRPTPGKGAASVVMGLLPEKLSALLNQRLQALLRARRVAITSRTE